MYTEEELIQLSALQHLVFCERQCALIHIEQVWAENRLTAEGRIMHEHVHDESRESRGDLRIEHGVPLHSLQLGLVGKADMVEYHHVADWVWQPFPIEYKRGKPKPDHSDMIQLCAQALCLEEMMNVEIPSGALFYGKTRHRFDVIFNAKLRSETEEAIGKVRALIESGQTPKPVYTKRCESCSLISECLPKTIQKKRSVKSYLKRVIGEP